MKLRKAIGILRSLRIFLVCRVLTEEGEGCDKNPYGSIYAQVRGPKTIGPDGSETSKVLLQYGGTSIRPGEEWRIMETALELARAVQLRNVDITPEVLYRHVVGRDYVPVLIPGTRVTQREIENHRRYLDMIAGQPPSFDDTSAFGEEVSMPVMNNFISHHRAWRKALGYLAGTHGEGVAGVDEDQLSYWKHELQAFDAAYAELGIGVDGKKS